VQLVLIRISKTASERRPRLGWRCGIKKKKKKKHDEEEEKKRSVR
jgi:hypothetical protein